MDVRLLDVFILGPAQILIGLHIKDNIFLSAFMIITGIMNILYNGHNYLHYNYGYDSLSIFRPYMNDKFRGKTQWQRLYNIFIMYPIFLYIYMTQPLPQYLEYILLADIIVGFIYNSVNFIRFYYY